jgi:hypothetical protein
MNSIEQSQNETSSPAVHEPDNSFTSWVEQLRMFTPDAGLKKQQRKKRNASREWIGVEGYVEEFGCFTDVRR